MADVTGLAVVRHFEGFKRDFLRINFVVPARFREARIDRAILGEQGFEAADDVLGKVLEILARLGQVAFYPLHLLAVLVDVKKGDAADAHGEQALHVRLREFPDQFLAERLEPFVNGGQDGFIGFALLDPFVDALLDKDPLQGPEVEFVLELGFLELAAPA